MFVDRRGRRRSPTWRWAAAAARLAAACLPREIVHERPAWQQRTALQA